MIMLHLLSVLLTWFSHYDYHYDYD